jgi:hypothetical protein
MGKVIQKQFAKCHLMPWWSELATEVVRFDTMRLLSFGGLWNLVYRSTNHKQFLSSRWRFDVSLAKLSCNYAEMSSRISSKEQECASRVVGDICWILCSTFNRSMCTLYWNKNIGTFLINGAFYYKIKSCTLVGTPYICRFKKLIKLSLFCMLFCSSLPHLEVLH